MLFSFGVEFVIIYDIMNIWQTKENRGVSMNSVEPIRSKKKIEDMKIYIPIQLLILPLTFPVVHL